MPHPPRSAAVICPVRFTAPTYDRNKMLKNLRKAGAARILLVAEPMNADTARMTAMLEKLAAETRFFQENGLDVWYWRWAFWMEGNPPFTRMSGFHGESEVEICPLDPAFREFVRRDLQAIARTGVNGILYDDDFRFGSFGFGLGCLCDRHLKLAESKLGGPIDREHLEETAFGGKPNPVRDALLAAWGESLNEFARLSRAAVDEVDPGIRIGMCCCLSSYDNDGTEPAVLARLLAGRNRPFVRLIGAPYWAVTWGFRIRLPEIIEYGRMQNSWIPEEFEVVCEGDPYPRPRFNVPASYLELFDSALRFADGFDGIQKYMFDYTSSAEYETGYLDMHLDDRSLFRAVARMTAGLDEVGIRVWREEHILAGADLSDVPEAEKLIDGAMFYPQAAWALAAHGIPTVHRGAGCAAIVFGDSARTLPESFRARPLILDLQAARLLTERGWDVGLRECGERFCPTQEEFSDGERIALLNRRPGSRRVTPAKNAKILSRFPENDVPASWSFRTPEGGAVLVFNFEGIVSDETSYRNYCRPKQIRDFLAACGVRLPAAVATRNPDLYLQCRSDGRRLAVGLWNCSADYAAKPVIELGESYRRAEFAGCGGRLTGNGRKLVIDHLAAFRFALVRLTR